MDREALVDLGAKRHNIKMMWTGRIWLRTRASGSCSVHGNGLFDFEGSGEYFAC